MINCVKCGRELQNSAGDCVCGNGSNQFTPFWTYTPDFVMKPKISTSNQSTDAAKQIIIIEYLAKKMGYNDKWITEESPVFMGRSPLACVLTGEGQHIIDYIEVRLGLTSGAGF